MDMRMLVNGVEGALIGIFIGAEVVLNVMLLNADGTLRTQATNTVTLELYGNAQRTGTPTSLAAAAVTAASGLMSVTISEAALAALTPGKTYYGFAKEVTTGTVTSFSPIPVQLKMR